MFEIPTEIFTNFNEVVYYDEPHKYYLNGKNLISTTTLIHKYEPPFDEEYWSIEKAYKYNIHPEEIKDAWKFINVKGTMKGSIIHDYAENKFLNKIFKYPKDSIIKEFGFDPIIDEYNITKRHVDNFHKIAKNKLIPIKTECIIYDEESMVGGMFDMLFYNVTKNEYQIYDWKTNKSFSMFNERYKMLGCLSDLDNCDFETYSLQLSLYKYIIEKNTNIKLGKSYVVWFSHNNLEYRIIEVADRTAWVKKIFNELSHN